MCNVLKLFGAIVMFLVIAMVGMSYAQEGTSNPCPTCPQPQPCPAVEVICRTEPVTVTCKNEPVTVQCPPVTIGEVVCPPVEIGEIVCPKVECNPWISIGLREVRINGRIRCGDILTNGAGGFILDSNGKRDFFVLQGKSAMVEVDSCE